MEQRVGPGFLDYNIRLMRTIGLWPLDTKSRPLLAFNFLYTALLVVSLAVVSVCQTIEIFVSPDITSMASAVDLATLTASALFKMIYMMWYRSYFQALLDKIDSTFLQSDLFFGDFNMSDWVKNSKRFINFYVSMGGPMLLLVFGVSPYFMPSYISRDSSHRLDNQMYESGMVQRGNSFKPLQFHQAGQPTFNDTLKRFPNHLNNNNKTWFIDKQRKLPFNCWFPFDVTWSPLYEIVYLLELIPLTGSGHLYLVSDSFFYMIIYLICGQLELLKASFRGLGERYVTLRGENKVSTDIAENHKKIPVRSPKLWEVYSKEKGIEKIMNEDLIKCVDFYYNLIQIIKELDLLLRSMVLVDFVHAVISLSFAMLQTATSNTALEWFQMIVFISVCIVHQFFNNYFAEIITQKQMSVAETVYETPWVEGTDLHKMTVYMTLNQANRPVRLSGWRMYHLGLGTFVEFMKLLGSYFLVLQSLHADESKGGR